MNTKISVSERDALSAASSRLTAVLGQVRLFTPEEMLALSGFPHDFAFPPDMPLRHRFQCIGNSVNVRVVQAVMQCLFEDQKDT
jgi:site-specific DNA-cytosine methylase